jgi:hypothetical protein
LANPGYAGFVNPLEHNNVFPIALFAFSDCQRCFTQFPMRLAGIVVNIVHFLKVGFQEDMSIPSFSQDLAILNSIN